MNEILKEEETNLRTMNILGYPMAKAVDNQIGFTNKEGTCHQLGKI